jgi:competence protein ComEA
MDILRLKKYLEALKTFKPQIINVGCFILGFISFYFFSLVVSQDQNLVNVPEEVGAVNGAKAEVVPSCDLYVDVNGAVNYPGVYCLPSGARLIDAINKAKGFNKLYAQRYVEQKLNLSLPLEESQKIYVPYFNDLSCQSKNFSYEISSSGHSSGGQTPANNGGSSCVSINDGTLEQLKTLKGVGDSIGQKIIDARPYKSINDLDNVSGIGDKMFADIKSVVCL